MHWGLGICALEMGIFGKRQCPSPWQRLLSCLCCFLAGFISWQQLSSEALWGLKGTAARCWPRCFWHLADWFGLWPLSPSLSDVLICSVRQVFCPAWYLRSEMSHLALDLGLSQSSVDRLEHLSQCARIHLFVLHTQKFFRGTAAFFFLRITCFKCALLFFNDPRKNIWFSLNIAGL